MVKISLKKTLVEISIIAACFIVGILFILAIAWTWNSDILWTAILLGRIGWTLVLVIAVIGVFAYLNSLWTDNSLKS